MSEKRMLLLEEWAARYFSKPPSLYTLRAMVRNERISPQPEKVGKSYYVRTDAEVVSAGYEGRGRRSLVQRMRDQAAA